MEEFMRQKIMAYEPTPHNGRCSCCGLASCDYDESTARVLSEKYGLPVHPSYVASSQYWRDLDEWKSS